MDSFRKEIGGGVCSLHLISSSMGEVREKRQKSKSTKGYRKLSSEGRGIFSRRCREGGNPLTKNVECRGKKEKGGKALFWEKPRRERDSIEEQARPSGWPMGGCYSLAAGKGSSLTKGVPISHRTLFPHS